MKRIILAVLTGAVAFFLVGFVVYFGLLYGIAIAFDLYAVTNWSNLNVALVEPFVTAARIAVVGGLVGWVLGRATPRAAPANA